MGLSGSSAVVNRVSREGLLTVEEETASLIVACHALKQGQRVTDTVASRRSELAGIQERIDGDDLLKQAGHDAKAVPKNQRQFRYLFPLFAQFHQGALPPVGVH